MEEPTKNYVNNAALYECIKVYKEKVKDAELNNKQKPKIPDFAGISIQAIADNMIRMQRPDKAGPAFLGYCVDEQTEALTKRGWLSYDKIALDDMILSYDQDSTHLVWSPITNLYINHYEGLMHHLYGKTTIDALVTPNHKFLTKEYGIIPIENIKIKDHLIIMGNHVIENEEIYDDSFLMDPKKSLSPEFILSLSQRQKILLIDAMILGDGWIDKNHIDNFVMLCTLAGFSTGTHFNKSETPFGYCEWYTVNIYKKYICPMENIDLHGGRPGPRGNNKIGKINKPTYHYDGIVWCPSTLYGCFVCRRNNKVYITGNSFTNEMISDAVENSIMYFDNFDPDKSKNPFAYFSKIIYYAFLRRIAKEKKQLYIKYKIAINHGIFDAVSSPDSDSDISSFEVFDNLVDYVVEYEKKQAVKKLKVEKKPKKKKNLDKLEE